MAEDATLSRWKPGFNSPWGHQQTWAGWRYPMSTPLQLGPFGGHSVENAKLGHMADGCTARILLTAKSKSKSEVEIEYRRPSGRGHVQEALRLECENGRWVAYLRLL